MMKKKNVISRYQRILEVSRRKFEELKLHGEWEV